MLAIARALASKPDLIMLDEPTEGLSPIMVDVIRSGIAENRARGVSILLVEQNIALALAVAELFYVISRGTIVYRATREEVAAEPKRINEHLGVGTAKSNRPGAGMNASKDLGFAIAGAANAVEPQGPGLPATVLAETGATNKPTPDMLRRVFGTFATGVTVIGARRADGGLVGMTANSFASVSLDPPLVLFCVARSLAAFKAYAATSHFSISILSQAAKSVSGHFARTGVEKWSTVAHRLGETGVPLLTDALATMECETVARHDAGDHLIVVGRVLRVSHADAAEPLLFFGSHYRRLDPQTPDQEADGDMSFLVWG